MKKFLWMILLMISIDAHAYMMIVFHNTTSNRIRLYDYKYSSGKNNATFDGTGISGDRWVDSGRQISFENKHTNGEEALVQTITIEEELEHKPEKYKRKVVVGFVTCDIRGGQCSYNEDFSANAMRLLQELTPSVKYYSIIDTSHSKGGHNEAKCFSSTYGMVGKNNAGVDELGGHTPLLTAINFRLERSGLNYYGDIYITSTDLE